MHARLLQLCLTLCHALDHSLPGSSVRGILQARILEWVVMPSSRGPSQPRDQTHISNVFCIGMQVLYHWASLVAQLVKNPPAMWETWVRSLGWEDSLEKGKTIHSGILAWRIPWTSPWGRKESDTSEQLSLFTFLPRLLPPGKPTVEWYSTFSSVQFSSVTQSCPTLCNP